MGHLQPWRETLEDLGLLGLVREAPPAVEPPRTGPVPAARPRPAESRPAPAPAATPAAGAPAAGTPAAAIYHPPTDPVGRPPAEALAACASLEDLRRAVQGCLACPLGPGRLNLVFGEGSPDADLMFIGEGPGRDEDHQGRPFVGRAGELLEKMIGAIGLDRSQVYIANIVKCRPPDNRTPTPQEAGACLGILRRQIDLVAPKVIVTLGATPLRELVGVTTGITRVRGQWHRLELGGGRAVPVMPTFHPAYVLRQYTQDVRRAVWEDLKSARRWLDGEGGGPA